ncbi:MAG: hypothetical protein JO295_10820 [Verrucomicrobia bacterium]|nr:hypothetical protein [Verrucomicrobiota bacterium]
MQTLVEIERAIEQLPSEEVQKLALWLRERAADAWDAEIERDARGGRLDALIAEADEAIACGRVAEMP